MVEPNVENIIDSLSIFEEDDYLLFKPHEQPNVEYQTLFRNIFAYNAAIKILSYDI